VNIFEDLPPAERSLRSRAAVHTSWANTADWSARTAPARAAMDRRFEDQVDPDRVLPPELRAKRAKAARSAYYADLGARSAACRRKRAQKSP
jgi:hypothetical protein